MASQCRAVVGLARRAKRDIFTLLSEGGRDRDDELLTEAARFVASVLLERIVDVDSSLQSGSEARPFLACELAPEAPVSVLQICTSLDAIIANLASAQPSSQESAALRDAISALREAAEALCSRCSSEALVLDELDEIATARRIVFSWIRDNEPPWTPAQAAGASALLGELQPAMNVLARLVRESHIVLVHE